MISEAEILGRRRPPLKSILAWTTVWLLVLGFGLWLRCDDYPTRRANPEHYRLDGEPALLNLDGYYYLRLARDLDRGTYTATDSLRAWPDLAPRPRPAPLISLLTAVLARLPGASLASIAIWLPALLGPLLAIPVFLLGRELGVGRAPALLGALASVASLEFVERTRLGFFDTDWCNVIFLTATITALARWLRPGDRRPLSALIGALVWIGLWFLAWHTARPAVLLIASVLLLLTLLPGYRCDSPWSRSLRLIVLGIAVCVGLLLTTGRASEVPAAATTMRDLLGGGEAGIFPRARDYISELDPVGLREVFHGTLPGVVPLIVALVGLVALFRRDRRPVLLLPLLILTLLSAWAGARWLIFAAPLIGLGLAGFTGAIGRWRGRAGHATVAVLAVWVVVGSALQVHSELKGPLVFPLREALTAARENTPAGSVIWTTWAAGYPVSWVAEAAVPADGEFMEGRRLVYLSFPFTTPDQGLAARWMHFLVVNGFEGVDRIEAACDNNPGRALQWLQRVLAQPEEAASTITASMSSGRLLPVPGLENAGQWCDFLFPTGIPPTYLLLHPQMMTACGWYRFGTWDPIRGDGHPGFYATYNRVRQQGRRLSGSGGLDLDLDRPGRLGLEVDGDRFEGTLSHVQSRSGRGVERIDVDPFGGLAFEWKTSSGFGVLMPSGLAGSVFNRLWLYDDFDPRYFRPVRMRSPQCQIWQLAPPAADGEAGR